MNKLSDYVLKNHIEKEINILSCKIIIPFIIFSFFISLCLYQNLTILSFVFIFVTIVSLIIQVFVEKYILNKHNLLFYWSKPHEEIIDGITYQIIYKYQHYKSEGMQIEEEKRFFHKGLLSHHKESAIQSGFLKYNNNQNNCFWFQGQKMNSLKEVLNAISITKNLANFP